MSSLKDDVAKLRSAFDQLGKENVLTLFNFHSTQSMALAAIEQTFETSEHEGFFALIV